MERPKGDITIERFYLATPSVLDEFDELLIEVPKSLWVQTERYSGFRGHRDGEPATGGFSASNGLRGTRKTVWTTIPTGKFLTCQHCERFIKLVNEEFYSLNGLTSRTVYRHDSSVYPYSLGPLECRLPVIRHQAVPAKER